MFFGQKDLAIDDKSRLVLPAAYRNEFTGGKLFASLGMDSCIELYPAEAYEKKAQSFMALSDFDPVARRLKRTFLSNTFDIELDSHNRILLPKPLIAKLNLKKKVILTGMLDHLELWDEETFIKNAEMNEETFSSDAMQLLNKQNGNL